MPEWSIGEIAKLAGITPRTVRYYVELGLLPPPDGLGRSAGYGQEHLDRLLVIKRLQADRFSLDEIRAQLATLAPAAATSLASAKTPLALPDASSAAEYLARLRESPERYPGRSMERLTVGYSVNPTAHSTDSYVGEQWTRIPLSEDIELHVKRRGNRIDPRIARLIKEARRIISEEYPK
jgi:DNA-binding transcriptional MerR regulator